MYRYFLIAAVLLLVGCRRPPLQCRSEYLYPYYLASEQIDTPDPWRICFYGQQLIIYWNLPGVCFDEPVTLTLEMRYGDRSIDVVTTEIGLPKGSWVYRLINADYWKKEGILSYHVQASQGGCLLAEWKHHLWVDLIEMPID